MNQKIIEILNSKCHLDFDDNQSEMARRLGLVQGTLSKILRGEVTHPNRTNATKIAKFLGVSRDAIYEDEGNIEQSISTPSLYEDIPEKYQSTVKDVIEVFSSEDEGTKLALQQNIAMFLEKVRQGEEIKQLKRQIDTLQKALNAGDPPGAERYKGGKRS